MGILTDTFAISESELRGEAAWLADVGDIGMSTSSGEKISPANVITLSAVFASARNIAEDVARLPLKAYRRVDKGGKVSAADDPRSAAPDGRMVNLYSLVHDKPSVELTNLRHRSLLVWWALLRGNAYAEIVMNNGVPVDLPPTHPDRVRVMRDSDNRLFYRVRNKLGEKETDIPARNMIHIRGISDDGVMGHIIPLVGKDSFGVYMAAERFTGSFFGNGATLAGVLTFENDFKTQASREAYINAFNAKYAGAHNANKWMLADFGAKVEQLTANPKNSQLIETLGFRIEDVARWFRIPPVKIGHNTNTPYTNVESLGRDYHMDGIMPWTIRIEEEYNDKLVPVNDTDLFVEHVVEALMWADTKTRTEVHNMRITGGWESRNEARAIENKNPIPGGDQFVMMQNMAIVDDDGKPEPVNTPTPPTPPDAPAPPGTSGGGGKDSEAIKASSMPIFVDAAERVIDREAKALAGKKKWTFENLDEFYRGHHRHVVTAFTPVLVTMGKLVGSDVTGMAERYADMHVGESRRRLAADEDPSGWMIDRPAWIARHLTDLVVCNES